MANTINEVGSMDVSLKENGVIVDMPPAALLQHSVPHYNLRSHKDTSSDRDLSTDAVTTAITTPTSAVTPTNLMTPAAVAGNTFRCERCDNFETNSRASLLLHVVQCLSSPVRLKAEEPDPENLSLKTRSSSSEQSSNQNSMAIGVGLGTMQTEAANLSAAGMGSSPAASSASSTASSTSRKVFECDVCNKKFSSGQNMRRHKKRHTGVKPYECRVCQKRFFRTDNLAQHFTRHTKTLRYHCPICNRGFQKQIAMRAHFQNEHVGQHDFSKTCPLCSYRAGSMKSLRIHFFNRHGIDLDNPGTGGTSTLLPGSSAAVTAAAANSVASAAALPSHQSDSGESLRSMENATSPMHILTPHEEMSTLPENGAELFNVTHNSEVTAKALRHSGERENGAMDATSPVLEHHLPMDCNTLPSSTSSVIAATSTAHLNTTSKSHHHENHITPSTSLTPIKQEPIGGDLTTDASKKNSASSEHMNGSSECSELDFFSSNNRLTSLIKVSHLKSLLHEDLNNVIQNTGNSTTNNNNNNNNNNSFSCNSTPICNDTIASTGQDAEASSLNRKQILTCLFCGIEFPDETLYFLHKGCHCESNPWKCNICGEQCNNVYEFNAHLLSKSHQ